MYQSGDVGTGDLIDCLCGMARNNQFKHICDPERTEATMTGKSRTVAVLLALFLGGMGAHKFYLGKVGAGLLYLLFCWTFIPAIVAFIEGIRWLCMSNESFATRYS